MPITQSEAIFKAKVEIAARSLASDDDLVRMYGSAALTQYRDLIERARAEGLVSLRAARARATARSTAKVAKA